MQTRKPTGDVECLPEIERAHEINSKIQVKVACHDLADDKIADFKALGARTNIPSGHIVNT